MHQNSVCPGASQAHAANEIPILHNGACWYRQVAAASYLFHASSPVLGPNSSAARLAPATLPPAPGPRPVPPALPHCPAPRSHINSYSSPWTAHHLQIHGEDKRHAGCQELGVQNGTVLHQGRHHGTPSDAILRGSNMTLARIRPHSCTCCSALRRFSSAHPQSKSTAGRRTYKDDRAAHQRYPSVLPT